MYLAGPDGSRPVAGAFDPIGGGGGTGRETGEKRPEESEESSRASGRVTTVGRMRLLSVISRVRDGVLLSLAGEGIEGPPARFSVAIRLPRTTFPDPVLIPAVRAGFEPRRPAGSEGYSRPMRAFTVRSQGNMTLHVTCDRAVMPRIIAGGGAEETGTQRGSAGPAALLVLMPKAGAVEAGGEAARIRMYLSFEGPYRDAPDVESFRIGRRNIAIGEILHGDVLAFTGAADPLDSRAGALVAEVIEPGGVVVRLPCFLVSDSPDRFAFRYCVRKTGAHRARVLAISPGGIVSTGWEEFDAAPGRCRGFVRAGGPREAAFVRGEECRPHVPVGINIAWPPQPDMPGEATATRLAKMGTLGLNWARIWLCGWGYRFHDPEGVGGPAIPDLESLDRLDRVFDAALAAGVDIQLCIENAHEFRRGSLDGFMPAGHGGMGVRAAFFTDHRARGAYKDKLTYLVARYGAYPNLFAFELWNEVDEAIRNDSAGEESLRGTTRAAWRAVKEWHREMAAHLKGADPFGHMVTTSVADEASFGDLFDVEGIDFAQAHLYLPRWSLAAGAAELDEGLLAGNHPRRTEGGKPWLIAEFGYAPERPLDGREGVPDRPARNLADSAGILLGNALWSSLAGGGGSSAMFWWWDDYVERHGLWGHFAGPAAFARQLAALPQPSARLADDGKSALRLIGHRTSVSAAFWIHERRATALSALEAKFDPPVRRGARVRLPAMAAGRYAVRWFPAWPASGGAAGDSTGDRGVIEATRETIEHPGGPMDLAVPYFKGGIAAILDGR
ncbi:MAG: cellulase family glycosylhydrolase [Planctomycetota bacterium]|nr:cellulase family glycosylhydrolase [Planctomycetota bacterium]